jgi:hypothetical protein
MHARIAPTPIPDLIRRVVANPFLPVARRELVHPIGGVRRGGSRSREGVDGRDVAAIFFFFFTSRVREWGLVSRGGSISCGRVLQMDSLVPDDGVRNRLHVLMPQFQVVRDNLNKFVQMKVPQLPVLPGHAVLIVGRHTRTGRSTAHTALSTTSPVKMLNLRFGTNLRGANVEEKGP